MGLAVSHKVHGDWHFFHSSGRLGGIENSSKRLGCTNQNDKKNPTRGAEPAHRPSRKFSISVPPVAWLSTRNEERSTQHFARKHRKRNWNWMEKPTGAQFTINRVQMRIGMMM